MLKYLREKMKLTQAELAVLVGVSESYIYKIESGKREPSVPTARKIGEVFGVCYKVLLSVSSLWRIRVL
jgi:DNA-binding XRE family transcriptional regulator